MMPDINEVKDLTFHSADKSDDELWAIVREACRKDTPTWRAYEVLHGRFTLMRNRERARMKDTDSDSHLTNKLSELVLEPTFEWDGEETAQWLSGEIAKLEGKLRDASTLLDKLEYIAIDELCTCDEPSDVLEEHRFNCMYRERMMDHV
jgi:hypothetical protein